MKIKFDNTIFEVSNEKTSVKVRYPEPYGWYWNKTITDSAYIDDCAKLKSVLMSGKRFSEKYQEAYYRNFLKKHTDFTQHSVILDEIKRELAGTPTIDSTTGEILTTETPAPVTPPEPTEEEKAAKRKKDLEDLMEKLIRFFSEFDFEPNFRFVNSFAYACNSSRTVGRDFVTDYFKLTDHMSKDAVIEKIKCQEFTEILDGLKEIKPKTRVNTRFKVYYGSQGTGKTTKALEESDGRCVVCHSAMLPSDLMEDFEFVDGKAQFKPSALQEAMTEGKAITLDEINLLPFESLRFLQGIVDGKESFIYKGKEIKIADGFKIIGTMNLTVNGATYALPEPLVDRSESLKEFKLTASNLVNSLI